MQYNNHYPYILIGRGIAGVVLSTKLTSAGIPHLIIDAAHLSASSKIAAGLVNPIVLKRLKIVADAKSFMDVALPFYKNLEVSLQAKFLHRTPIWHILNNQEEQNQWLEKSEHPALRPFLKDVLIKNPYPELNAPFGLGEVKDSFWVDSKGMLAAHKKHNAASILQEKINLSHIDFANNTLHLPNFSCTFKHLIDCSGHLSRNTFPEISAAFSPTKGEILVVHSSTLPENIVLHAGVFILPLGNQLFKVGATYVWDDFTDVPTEDGKAKLIEEFHKIFKGTYTVVNQLAGVRPTVNDRKPLIGNLNNSFYTFNGMGSRGVLMAPHLAQLLIEHVEAGKAIPIQYEAARYL